MVIRTAFLFLVLTQAGFAQVYSARVIGHTPDYERILIPKGHLLRPATLRGVDDLTSQEHYSATNRIDQLFADPSRVRTNGYYNSCLSEVPVNRLSLHCPGHLLAAEQVRELLRDTMAIPRRIWTNHPPSGVNGRYVFSLTDRKNQEYVIDERMAAFAIVYFPDGTYRCVVGLDTLFLRGSNQTVQRAGASRCAQRQIERHRRLAPVAHPDRSA